MGDRTMSTNTTTLHRGSAQPTLGAFAGSVAAILVAIAGLLALNAALGSAAISPAPASDAQVQKALIDVRAGERASYSVGSDAAVEKALISVRAGERESRSIGSDASVQKQSISVRAGERDLLSIVSNAQVQKALIDVRASERASLGH